MKAKFTIRIKEAIVERDDSCIICSKQGTDCHHVYYGTESNYGLDRNNINQGVLLCRECHGDAHSCKRGEGVRQKCIDYLLTIN